MSSDSSGSTISMGSQDILNQARLESDETLSLNLASTPSVKKCKKMTVDIEE